MNARQRTGFPDMVMISIPFTKPDSLIFIRFTSEPLDFFGAGFMIFFLAMKISQPLLHWDCTFGSNRTCCVDI